MGKKDNAVKGINKFACSSCSKEFKYESEKIRHEQSHTTLFECQLCHKTFNFLSALKRHEKQHDRNGSVQCKECGRSFRDETLLKRHARYSHKGSYTCAKCLAIFPSEQALGTHEKTHQPQSERRYRCRHEGCGKSFNFPHHLKHHELTHSDSKQHYCNVCGKGFIQLYHLKSHLKNHVPEKWLNCVLAGCKKRFATEYALKRHVATHKLKSGAQLWSDSPLNGNVERSEDYVLCPVCGELLTEKKMAKHSINCTKPNKERSEVKYNGTITLTKGDLNDETNVLKNKEIVLKDDLKPALKRIPLENRNEVVNDCKSALGGCLADEDSKGTCLCDHITGDVDSYTEQLEMMISEKTETSKSENSTTVFEELNNYKINIENQCDSGACCSDLNYESSENKSAPLKCSKFKEVETMPEIEYRPDGVIKLSETFDKNIEFPCNMGTNAYESGSKSNAEVPVLYNSCKAVLGNCIVSGNDTIGEGCFCARMGLEAQLPTAQEIDEITIFNDDWSS